MKEAGINAKQSGDRGITAKNVKKVTEARLPFMFVNGTSVANNYQSTLHKFKGWDAARDGDNLMGMEVEGHNIGH